MLKPEAKRRKVTGIALPKLCFSRTGMSQHLHLHPNSLSNQFSSVDHEVVLDQKLGEVFQLLMMNVTDISLWEVASSHVTCDAGRGDWRLHRIYWALRLQFNSVAQSCLRLCDPMNRSTPGLPVHHQLLESTQTHVHWVSDSIQPSHSVVPFSSCPQSFPASGSFQMSQLFASGAKVLKFQLQHQYFQWTPRTDLL